MRHLGKLALASASLVWIAAACGSGDDSAANNGSDASVGSSGGDSGGSPTTNDSGGPVILPASCNGSVASVVAATASGLPNLPSGLAAPSGFKIEVVAAIGSARELAALPNGDLLVATNGGEMDIIPNAEADGAPGKSVKFADALDNNPAGVTYVPTTCTIYWGTNKGVWKATYKDGDLTGDFGSTPIAQVRQGTPTPGSDGDVHVTTSLAYANGSLYASVGSGCNACTEVDPTRATIQQMDPDGSNMKTKATRIRNAIALVTNPATGTVWAGGAGQDHICDNAANCPNGSGHPYEFFDAVTSHPGEADYGWPSCEENHQAYGSGADCSATVQPLIEFTAYSTLIGAAFYPANQMGSHAFPAQYKGGAFITSHGSWHTSTSTNNHNGYFSPPRLAFVPMSGDTPTTAVDWSDPTKQWSEFVTGWSQNTARATGVAVGAKGSLFVADDQTGLVYRIRPN
jgi:glucose/arabinose dehydrogenase